MIIQSPKNKTARLCKWLLIIFFSLAYSQFIFAQAQTHRAWGTVADTVHSGLGSLNTLFFAAAYMIGIAFALGALLRYKHYRDNPTQVSMSSICFLAIFGVLLIGMPLLLETSAVTLFGEGARINAKNPHMAAFEVKSEPQSHHG